MFEDLEKIDEELLDVLNEDGAIVGREKRGEVHLKGLLHQEVHVWLFDKEKNIFFTKSPSHKNSAGLLDSTVGGHVGSGEDSLFAAVREMEEETGIKAKEEDLLLLGKFSGRSTYTTSPKINNFVRMVYIYKLPIKEEELRRDPGENDGFQKFPIRFLQNMNEKEKALFHRYGPTHEIPIVLNYLKNL